MGATPLVVTDGFVGNCVSLAAAALIIYDYALTIHQEVQLIWHRGRRSVLILFLANRVIAILVAATVITTTLKFASVAWCKIATYVDAIAELPLFIVWSVFNSLRVHAVGGQKWPLTTTVFLLSMMPFAMNVYYISTFDSWRSVITGQYQTCSPPKQLDQWFHIGFEIVTRGPLMIADAMVIGVTWRATFRMRNLPLPIRGHLFTVMLWDGTIYFLALLVLNAAQLAVFMSTNGYGDVSSLVTAISSSIITRFLLSLHSTQRRPTVHGGSTSWSETFSHSIYFPDPDASHSSTESDLSTHEHSGSSSSEGGQVGWHLWHPYRVRKEAMPLRSLVSTRV